MSEVLPGECLTCGEIDDVEGECSESRRPCGHHCNHTWTHDSCCWCGWEVPADDAEADTLASSDTETTTDG